MAFADFLRAFFALALTLGLVGLAAVALRRFGPDALARFTPTRKERRLAIVETLVLDPSRRLVVVSLDGEVFALAQASARHATIARNLATLLRQHLHGSPCTVFVADMQVHVAPDSAFYYPDVFVTCSEAAGKKITREILAAGYCRPEAFADLPGECIFLQDELPAAQDIRYTVTPRDCFGNAGVSIKS